MGKMHRRAPIVLLAVVVVGCSSGSSNSGETTTVPEITLLATSTTSTTSTTTTSTTSTSTTTTSTTSTTLPPATTTTVDPVIDALVLTTNGIGSATFGSEPEGVVGYVSTLLGPPSQDTGWVDPLSIGPCPGTQLRLVSWGGLVLEFGDVSSVADDRPHFYSFKYGVDGEIGVAPVGLVTDEGISAASRVSELVAAYPNVMLNPEDEFSSPNFYVNDDLNGLLTGLAGDDLVTLISGGRSCRE